MNINLTDANGKELKLGQKVKLSTGQTGQIVFECGAYGIGIEDSIDYELIEKEIEQYALASGGYDGTFNDHFISLWELYWNFGCEENTIQFVEILED